MQNSRNIRSVASRTIVGATAISLAVFGLAGCAGTGDNGGAGAGDDEVGEMDEGLCTPTGLPKSVTG